MIASSTIAPTWDVSSLEAALPRHMQSGPMRYQDFAPLGHGGKAEVFRCRDIYLDREVAYKVLHRSLADRQIEQQMLVREARIMASLDSPWVPAVHEVGRDLEGRPYFTMDLIAGRSLHAHLSAARDGSLPPERRWGVEELVTIVARLARVLDQAHRAGVVHGDVKPENVIVGDDGSVHLIDWGIARIVEQARGGARGGLIEDSWGRQGSALFMSPEQATREPFLTPSSDIYSLGVVLYECLTGHLPLCGENAEETLSLVATEAPPPPSAAAPEKRIPQFLDKLCLRALAKDPADRFKSMDTLATRLIDAAQDLLIDFERNGSTASCI